MRALVGVGCVLFSLAACSAPAIEGGDAGTTDRDAAIVGDAGTVDDAASATDAAPASDGGTVPEVCTGGVDEDGDHLTDCADDECWTVEACVIADVQAMVPGAMPCGDPIELDAEASAAACEAIGMPTSDYPIDCHLGAFEVTARVMCDSSGATAALWIEERNETPSTMRMISARMFELTRYERASVIDWERHVSGASTREGGVGFPIHQGSASSTVQRTITIRPAIAGDSISRLLGLQRVVSLIDLDMPMSMDSRSSLRTGGLTIVLP